MLKRGEVQTPSRVTDLNHKSTDNTQVSRCLPSCRAQLANEGYRLPLNPPRPKEWKAQEEKEAGFRGGVWRRVFNERSAEPRPVFQSSQLVPTRCPQQLLHDSSLIAQWSSP
jgi:hypothetical protein